ncbi:hypothetical protein ANO14919_112250 [Xylariales sp. No.14919]|nr:hypothetical protein ANO14919_112250 [Xylariales sp. No.14919]
MEDHLVSHSGRKQPKRTLYDMFILKQAWTCPSHVFVKRMAQGRLCVTLWKLALSGNYSDTLDYQSSRLVLVL